MRNVLKAIILGSCIIPFSVLATVPQIKNVKAMQQYPWGRIYLSFEVLERITPSSELQTAPYVVITARDNERDEICGIVSSLDSYLSGDTGTEIGVHKVVWDIETQGVAISSTNVTFEISYEYDMMLYCVIDLSAGPSAKRYPVSYLPDVPANGWQDEYKTTKLVLRRIEPAQIPTRTITTANPFFCGIFEVTQKQYELVMGDNPSTYKGDSRPVECVSYNMIRGSSLGANWPSSSSVDSTSFMGKLRARTGINFDLPTEVQWEYACRAGTTTLFNDGTENNPSLWYLGRYRNNNKAPANSNGYRAPLYHATVGTYRPNAWGLYDMHGNVAEWCLDWYNVNIGQDSYNLWGVRMVRGGGWDSNEYDCSSSSRSRDYCRPPAYKANDVGFRIVRTLSED